jgi:pyruvate formate lyase activating enzyme
MNIDSVICGINRGDNMLNTEISTLQEMKLGGLTRLTTIDFPGHIAAVLYTRGCPWRCSYCHNWQMLDPDEDSSLSWKSFMTFLKQRKGFLDGVVFSGGEPCFWRDIGGYILQVKELGYDTALHTSGIYPGCMKILLESDLLDWVAMDIKAPFDEYESIVGVPVCIENIRESTEILINSGIGYEFRTTFHPELLSSGDILDIGQTLSRMGAERYVVQKCRTEYALAPALREKIFDINIHLKGVCKDLTDLFPNFELR